MPARSRSALGLLLVGLALPGGAGAIDVSPDVTADLGGVVTADEDVAVDDGGSFAPLALLGLPPLPAHADVVGYELDGTTLLFAFDTTVVLEPTLLTVEPRDVALWDGTSWHLGFDGSAEGVPQGARIDAVGVGAGFLLLSFDVSVDLPGLPGVPDEAVVQFVSPTYSFVLESGDIGASAGPLDVDGVSFTDAGALRVSFDTSGSVGGVAFDDEDALDWDGATWTLAYDGSARDPDWAGADLVALPEPDARVSRAAAAALLLVLARRPRGFRRHPLHR